MPASKPAIALALLALSAMAGCTDSSPGISVAVSGEFRRSNGALVDLSEANPDPWDRVCIFGPGADKAAVKKALGFAWDSETKSVIRSNDGIALLVFASGRKVSSFAEHQRNMGDFATLDGKCFVRAKARFEQDGESKGHPAGMYPKAD
jgi:hypothetical protein